jgi:hypothetical protein
LISDFADATEPDGGVACYRPGEQETKTMNGIIYIIGLVVVIIAVLSFFGLR